MAACKVEKEAIWISRFLIALGVQISTLLVKLHINNKEAISLIENPKFYQQTKYIEVQYHWIWEIVK